MKIVFAIMGIIFFAFVIAGIITFAYAIRHAANEDDFYRYKPHYEDEDRTPKEKAD